MKNEKFLVYLALLIFLPAMFVAYLTMAVSGPPKELPGVPRQKAADTSPISDQNAPQYQKTPPHAKIKTTIFVINVIV